ncbi:MAG: leucine-rich repeat protein [Spirochaetaceae bacterium]|nr:leucine-rich repeat protein [Spirochaetaceae bacterium]
MKKLSLVISILCFVICALTAQASTSALTADLTVDGTTYPKTGFAEVSGVTIEGSGKRGAFINGRTVTLSPYIIGKYPVTQDLYKAVAKKIPDAYSNPSKFQSDTLPAGEIQGLRPVEQVDFFEIARFCNKLSELQGLEPVFTIDGDNVTFDISKNGWRIPTEAEWECAARGGNPNVGSNWNRVFAGATSANTALSYAWVKSNSDEVTHEVGLKTPNALGLYDMIGNVYEWCIDLSGDIETGTYTNPTGATTGNKRVQRSCSKGSAKVYDALERDEGAQDDYWPDVGFRLCRTIQTTAATAVSTAQPSSAQTTPAASQTSTSALTANVTVDGTTYPKTGFAEVNGVTIRGSGSRGAFISGRTVTLSPYIIGKYLVTQDFYKSVAKKIPDAYTAPSKHKADSLPAGEEQGLRPVEQVDFFEIARFCNKLSELQGLEPVFTINGDSVTFDITKNGWRIPTEAEWECAARGGNPDDNSNWNKVYAGASSENTALSYAWVKANSDSVTHEVGLKTPNSLGLYDMLGNVYEWCIDLSGDIKTGTYTNPTGATTGTKRVQRSCGMSSSKVRDALERDEGAQDDYWQDVGFRLCRTIPATTSSAQTSYAATTASAAADRIVNGVLYIKDGATEIKASAYRNNNEITKVVIPSTVTKIGELAFQTCGNLKEVEIPASVTLIGNAAFQNCKQLTKVTLNEGLTTLNYRAFKGSGITEITIPASVTTIGNEVFTDCANLTTIRVTYGSKAHTFFKNNSHLVVIGAPEQTTQPTQTATAPAASTTTQTSSASSAQTTQSAAATSSAAISLDPTGWKKDTFTTSWKDYEWSFPIDKIGIGENTITFTYTSGGKKLCLKDAVIIADGRTILTDNTEKSAGSNPRSAVYTFTLSSVPRTLIMKAKARTDGGTNSVGTIIVLNHPRNNDKWVPNEFTTTWAERTYDMTDQLVPGANGLTVTFRYTSGAKKLCARNLVFEADGREIARFNNEVSAGTNPNSFTVSCQNLPANTRKLVLKGEFRTDGGTESYGTITTIPKLYTKQGTTINVNSGVQTLTRWTLSDELNATRIVLPSSVTTIETGALLRYCTISCSTQQQKNFCLENGYAVEGTYSIRNGVLTINSGVTLVSPVIARENTTITKIVLPETVKTIDAFAFYGMTALTEVNLPSSLEVIGASAFNGCSNLRSVEIPKTLKYIGTNAFRNTKITYINIGYDTVYEEDIHSAAGYAVDMSKTNIAVYRDAAPSSKPPRKTEITSSTSSSSAIKKEGTPVGQSATRTDLSVGKKQSNTQSATSTVTRSETTKLTNGVLEIGTNTTQLSGNSYKKRDDIKKVIIPGTVKTIGDYSFYNCPNLEEIIVDEGVEEIGFGTFMNNEKLASLTIPKSVKKISPFTRTWFFFNNYKLVVHCYAGSAGYDFARRMGFDIEILGIDESNADNITDIIYGRNTTISPVNVACNNVEHITIGKARTISENAFQNVPAKIIDIAATVTSIGRNAFHKSSNIRVVRGSYAETWAKQNGYSLYEVLADLSTYSKSGRAITEDFTRILCNSDTLNDIGKYSFNVTHPLSVEVVNGRLELTSYMLYPCQNVTITKKASDGTKTTVKTYSNVQPLARYVVLSNADANATYTVTSTDSFYKSLNNIPVNWVVSFDSNTHGITTSSIQYTNMCGPMCREWIVYITQLAYIVGSNSYESYFLTSHNRFFTGERSRGLNSTITNYLSDEDVRSLFRRYTQTYSAKLGASSGTHISEYSGVGSFGVGNLWLAEQFLGGQYYDFYEYATSSHEMMHNMGYDHDSNFCRNGSNKMIYQDDFGTIVEQFAALGLLPYNDDTILSTKVLWADDYYLKN